MRDFGKAIQAFSGRGAMCYVVPIGDMSTGQLDVLVLVPRRVIVPPEALVYFGAGTILAVVAFCLFVIGAQLAARDNEIEARRALLRGLQVGFVRMDPQMRIIEGNDRAEELLGAKLPPVARTMADDGRRRPERGTDGRATPPRHWCEVIDGKRILLASSPTPPFQKVAAAEAATEVGRGGRVRLFAPSLHLGPNNAPRWLEFKFTPILSATRGSIADGSFATFDEVPPVACCRADLERHFEVDTAGGDTAERGTRTCGE
jgi:hypothetical protein